MADKNESLRVLPFLSVASALGWDVSKFKTRKGGAEHFGPCAIHGSKSNQACFSYHQDGRFSCFSCQAKGRGAIDLAIAAKGLGFQAAVEWLQANVSAGTAQTTQPAQKPVSAASLASNKVVEEEAGELKPFSGRYHLHQVHSDWLNARVPDQAIREKYGVFMYSNAARKSAYQGRVLIPFKSLEGELYGYTGRLPEPKEGDIKYLIPSGFPKSRFVFGAHEAKQPELHRMLFAFESPFAALKFAAMRLPSVALYGWSMSDEQLSILRQLTRSVAYIPDRNKFEQGQAVATKLARHLWVKMPELPEGIEDPEQLSGNELLALVT